MIDKTFELVWRILFLSLYVLVLLNFPPKEMLPYLFFFIGINLLYTAIKVNRES
jgi:hypothetical protein